MIRLLLVRHGNTFESNQVPIQVGAKTDLPLTQRGRNQAESMAEYLLSRKIHPTAIFAGNLKRQTESASIIASPFDLKFLNEPALTEIDYGKWEGLSSQQISQQWPNEYIEWTETGKWPHSIFNGSQQHHLLSIQNWLNSLRNTYAPNTTIVAISSNGLIRFFSKEPHAKVKTGHFCELNLFPDRIEIKSWNTNPEDATLRA